MHRLDSAWFLRFVPPPSHLSDLSRPEPEALLVDLSGEHAALKQLVGELREEIARLKGLNGRPNIEPSGMDKGTGPAKRDKALKRLHANKAELPMVLDRPEIPLHTNGSENDIRCYVARRKIGAGTRSDSGRDCRDAFLGLAKTCAKLGIAVWDYLGRRLRVTGHSIIPPLEHDIRSKTRFA